MLACNFLSEVTLILLLVGGLADAQDLPIRINSPVVNGDDGMCPTDKQLETAINEQIQNIRTVVRGRKGTMLNPVPSCTGLPEDYGSGYYWIKASDSVTATRQYCVCVCVHACVLCVCVEVQWCMECKYQLVLAVLLFKYTS